MQRLCALEEIANDGLLAVEFMAPGGVAASVEVGRDVPAPLIAPGALSAHATVPHNAPEVAAVAPASPLMDAPDRAAEGVQAGDDLIAYRCGDEVRVWRNICPHAGRRLDWAPGRFLRDGRDLVCSHHGAVFELDGGRCTSGPCRGQALTAIACEVSEGVVWLQSRAT